MKEEEKEGRKDRQTDRHGHSSVSFLSHSCSWSNKTNKRRKKRRTNERMMIRVIGTRSASKKGREEESEWGKKLQEEDLGFVEAPRSTTMGRKSSSTGSCSILLFVSVL